MAWPALLHDLAEGVVVVLVLAEGVPIALGHDDLPAVLHRIPAQGLGHVVDVALPGPHGLGDAVAPHGPGGGLVGEHAPGVPLHVGAGVELGEGAHALGHHAVAVGGVGPLVGEALDLPGGKGAVGPDPGDDVGADGVADPVVDEGLLPAGSRSSPAGPPAGW